MLQYLQNARLLDLAKVVEESGIKEKGESMVRTVSSFLSDSNGNEAKSNELNDNAAVDTDTVQVLNDVVINDEQPYMEPYVVPLPPDELKRRLNVNLEYSKQHPEFKAPNISFKYLENIQPSSGRKKILILGQARAGSTFLAEMFNQNDEAFYNYELLFHTKKYFNEPEKLQYEQRKVLQDYFNNCESSKIEDHYPEAVSTSPGEADKFRNSFTFKEMCRRGIVGTCFPRRSESMKKVFLSQENQVNSIWQSPSLDEDFTKSCQSHKLTVAKISDFTSFGVLKELFQHDPDFYIVYTIRDPRGIFNSKSSIGDEIVWRQTSTQCANMNKMINYVRSIAGMWLRSKIIFVRFEDLAFFPKAEIDRVYSFIGIDQQTMNIPIETRDITKERFIKITHRNNKIASTQSQLEKKTIDDRTWIYDTNRDSQKVAFKWRWDLSLKNYLAIQDGCGKEFFNDLGYQKINKTTKLNDMRKTKVGSTYNDRYNSNLWFPLSGRWYYKTANRWGYEVVNEEEINVAAQHASSSTNEATANMEPPILPEYAPSFDRKKVLIVSEYRGGATFVSETFKQNNEAVFMFETLYMAQQVNDISQDERRNLQIKILSDYFNDCKYPLVSDYPLRNSSASDIEKNKEICSKANTCHVARTNSLDEFLEQNIENNKIPAYFTQKCKNRPITATKVIRLQDLSVLEAFKDDPNFYVINVVRDPRGLYKSRKFAPNYFEGYANPDNQCVNFKKNRDYAHSLDGAWLSEKMLSIRYEDIGLYPTESLRKIYKFIGRDSNIGDLLTKFQDLTIRHETSSNQIRKKRSPSDESWMYDTNRDSKKTSFRWRWDLDINEYQKVQDSCGPKLFEDFGYQWINSSQELDMLREKPLGKTYADRFNSNVFWPLSENFKFADTKGTKFLSEKVQEYPNRKKVLIVAEYRGGSTFTAEIFNKNPECVYNFETLYLGRKFFEWKQTLKEEQSKILANYFNKCEYPSKYDYELGYPSENDEICQRAGYCFLDKSDSVMTLDGVSDEEFPMAHKNLCLSKPITTSKIIRLQDLSVLEVFKNDPNFYVIYSMRDPRGMYKSREHVPNEVYADKSIQCAKYQSSVDYLRTPEGDWLNERLLAVRYEDLALFPLENVNKIYKFINETKGLDGVLSKFAAMTKGPEKQKKPAPKPVKLKRKRRRRSPGPAAMPKPAEKWQPKKPSEDGNQNVAWKYTTNRDSKNVVFKWRWDWDYSVYDEIQKGCTYELMEDLGYQVINSTKELNQIRKQKVGKWYTGRWVKDVFWPLSNQWFFGKRPANIPARVHDDSRPTSEPIVEDTSNKDRKKVLIVAEYRGGSSFTGHLFNFNEQATYSYESLYLTRTLSSTPDEMRGRQLYLLDQLLNQCNLPDWRDFYEDTPVFRASNEYTQMCSKGYTCLGFATKSLSKYDSLPDDQIKEKFKEDCLTKPIMASKVIRLDDLEYLELFKRDPNFKIIYIVKDPRSLYLSKAKVMEMTQESTNELCTAYNRNLKYYKSEKGKWLQDKMLTLRYEDLALHPVENMHKIYKFIDTNEGLPELDAMYQNLTNIDARESTFKWRFDLDMPDLDQIQNGCGRETFKDLGYQWVNTSTELNIMKEQQIGKSYDDRYNNDVYWPVSNHWLFEGANIDEKEFGVQVNSNSNDLYVEPAASSETSSEGQSSSAVSAITTDNPNRKKVLIMHEYLGGSQLLIEMFNQNKDAVYNSGLLYLSRTLEQDPDQLKKDQTKVLKNYFNDCKYPILEDYYVISDEFKATEEYTQACNRGHACLSLESTSMQEFYKFSDDDMPKEFNKACLGEKSITAAQAIRLEKINRLEATGLLGSASDVDPNFYTFYVFRDPRGIIAARNKQWEVDESEITYLCDTINENIKYLETQKSSNNLFNNHIIPVRYEEIELFPEESIPKIYNSINSFDTLGAEKVAQNFRDYFGTLDNSNRVQEVVNGAFEWKDIDDFVNKGTYKKVQDICGRELFDKLGYRFVTDNDHLNRIKSKSLGNNAVGFNIGEDDWLVQKSWVFGA